MEKYFVGWESADGSFHGELVTGVSAKQTVDLPVTVSLFLVVLFCCGIVFVDSARPGPFKFRKNQISPRHGIKILDICVIDRINSVDNRVLIPTID